MVSTSVEFVLEIYFVEGLCENIYVKTMFGFLTNRLVSGVLMLHGDGSESPTMVLADGIDAEDYCVLM